VDTRFSGRLEALQRRLLDGPGFLAGQIRRSVADGGVTGDSSIDAYVDKIRHHAYRIVDRDIEELKAVGWSEDQIYELSICAAFGAAARRLDAGLAAMEAARSIGEWSPALGVDDPTGRR
jgi:hypothetical protein